ncbi:hypothetical protein GF314_09400 [bacterium]|nr:hypothetical protein [bacterium]
MRTTTLTLMLAVLVGTASPSDGQDSALATIEYATWFADSTRVVFDHELHAEMLEISCAECHHAENCRSCHAGEPVTALATSRQVALHGACFRCHDQGASLDDCGLCHEPLTADADFGGVENSSPVAGADGRRMLDELAELEAAGELAIVGETVPFERESPAPPEDHIFLTQRAEGVSLVYFPHEVHAEDYGLDCAACHHMEGCGHCHGQTLRPIDVVELEAALMDNCIACHDDLDIPTSCDACHQDPHDLGR